MRDGPEIEKSGAGVNQGGIKGRQRGEVMGRRKINGVRDTRVMARQRRISKNGWKRVNMVDGHFSVQERRRKGEQLRGGQVCMINVKTENRCEKKRMKLGMKE